MESVLTAVLSGLVQRGTLTIVNARGRVHTFGDGAAKKSASASSMPALNAPPF